MLSTSLVSKNASFDAAACRPSATAFWRDASPPQTVTCMPNARP